MKITGIETFQTADYRYNMSMPIGVLLNDSKEDNLISRIKDSIKNGDKLYLVSTNNERMLAADRLIKERGL